MFELEVGTRVLAQDTLPAEVIRELERTGERITSFSLTPWEEHCTECAMPACYKTCDLYAPRMDGKCRRFIAGVEILPLSRHPQGYIARVSFKRWGQLMAYANTRLIPVDDAASIERRVRRVEDLAARLPGAGIEIAGRRGIAARLTRRWKQGVSTGAGNALPDRPDCMMVQVFNPGPASVRLSLTITAPEPTPTVPFQELLELRPGFNDIEIDAARIAARVDITGLLHVTLNPNIIRPEDEGLTLYFGLLAFVTRTNSGRTTIASPATAPSKRKNIKVAVWDLDNTLWSGTLVEDGLTGLQLREEAMTVVRELDRRGIVNSILSKNHPDEAKAALQHFGVTDYFVFPKIGWGEKGASMRQLIRDFNLGADTFAFIDDQEFERAQVVAVNGDVRAFDSRQLLPLLQLPEFNPPQSSESGSRRSFYRSEENRVQDSEKFGSDYLEFLRTCRMRADIAPARSASFDRIQELVQRTNQLNYSGKHYSRDEVSALLADPANEAFVLSCTDVYGDYGTVGFALVERERACMRDAMFSCRIQFKRVEHAMIAFLLRRYRGLSAVHFDANFCETKKNAAAAAVFQDMGFEQISQDGASRVYRFDLTKSIRDDAIVAVTFDRAP